VVAGFRTRAKIGSNESRYWSYKGAVAIVSQVQPYRIGHACSIEMVGVDHSGIPIHVVMVKWQKISQVHHVAVVVKIGKVDSCRIYQVTRCIYKEIACVQVIQQKRAKYC
jgi:hypothetical protein